MDIWCLVSYGQAVRRYPFTTATRGTCTLRLYVHMIEHMQHSSNTIQQHTGIIAPVQQHAALVYKLLFCSAAVGPYTVVYIGAGSAFVPFF